GVRVMVTRSPSPGSFSALDGDAGFGASFALGGSQPTMPTNADINVTVTGQRDPRLIDRSPRPPHGRGGLILADRAGGGELGWASGRPEPAATVGPGGTEGRPLLIGEDLPGELRLQLGPLGDHLVDRRSSRGQDALDDGRRRVDVLAGAEMGAAEGPEEGHGPGLSVQEGRRPAGEGLQDRDAERLEVREEDEPQALGVGAAQLGLLDVAAERDGVTEPLRDRVADPIAAVPHDHEAEMGAGS